MLGGLNELTNIDPLISEDDDGNSNSSDSDDTECYRTDSTEDESEDDDRRADEELELSFDSEVFSGKDGTQWLDITNRFRRGRAQRQNILRVAPGVNPNILGQVRSGQHMKAFELFMTQDIIEHIIDCTVTEAHASKRNDFNLSVGDFFKFLALVIARGVLGCRTARLDSLGERKYGPPFFHETMARNRFREILKFLRFDKKSDRATRLQTDKFTMFSHVWGMFVRNCNSALRPGENLTIDEQLIPCKTRCRFIQYMPNKPDKFGIKLWALVDVETKYFLNGFFYLGKDEERDPHNSLSYHVVMKLCQPFSHKGYNITCDNFFTSLSLAKELKKKCFSIVGTIRTNRRELPNVSKNDEKFGLHDTKVLRTEGDVTLSIYQAKKDKKISILSTLHNDIEISVCGKRKQETVFL